ncbi:MAG: hypothetical protein WHX52_20305 [Anaerolineae bacterium]
MANLRPEGVCVNVDDILKALTTLVEGHSLHTALESAIAQCEAITPHLLRVLEETWQDKLACLFSVRRLARNRC